MRIQDAKHRIVSARKDRKKKLWLRQELALAAGYFENEKEQVPYLVRFVTVHGILVKSLQITKVILFYKHHEISLLANWINTCSSSRSLFSLVPMTWSLYCYQILGHYLYCTTYCIILRSQTVSGKVQGLLQIGSHSWGKGCHWEGSCRDRMSS